MFSVIPTYVVRFRVRPVGRPEPVDAVEYRVPANKLGDFLEVLRFNGCEQFSVDREPTP